MSTGTDPGYCIWTNQGGLWTSQSFCNIGFVCGAPPARVPRESGPEVATAVCVELSDGDFRKYLESRGIAIGTDAVEVRLDCIPAD